MSILVGLNCIDSKHNINILSNLLLAIVCLISAIIGLFCFFHLIIILSGTTTR